MSIESTIQNNGLTLEQILRMKRVYPSVDDLAKHILASDTVTLISVLQEHVQSGIMFGWFGFIQLREQIKV